jgi:proline racemase
VKRVKTIDAEVAGEPVRLVVEGAPSVPGRTMVEKLNWLRRHGDDLRRLLMLEPRGHAGMHGAMLCESVFPGSHTGLISMHSAGFPFVSGEGIIGALTIAREHKLIDGMGDDLLVDTPAGVFGARVRMSDTRVAAVTVTGPSAFVHTAGLPIRIGSRVISVDIAFGGEFYAIADSEAIGIPIDVENAAPLIRMGREITEAVESTVHVEHPADNRLKDIQGAIFTGAARGGADLRSATVLDGEVLRRSPGVTGTAALMAVLSAMGVLGEEHRFAHEGVLGKTLQGRVAGRRPRDDDGTIIPVIEGSASITGYHEFVTG